MFKGSGNIIEDNISITMEFINFCLENNIQIDLKTGCYGRDIKKTRHGSYNIDLLKSVHYLYINGDLNPTKYRGVFFRDQQPRAFTVTLRRYNLRTLNNKETWEIYGADIDSLSRETNRQKYGSDFSIQSEQIKSKRKQTNDTKSQSEKDNIQLKRQQTNIERYGYPNPLSNPEVRARRDSTMMKLYSKRSLAGDPEVKAKIKETCIERYGTEHPTQSPEIQAKVKATNLKLYGVEYPFQSPEMQAKIQALNLERLGSRSPAGTLEVRWKIAATNLERYGSESPFGCEEVQMKIFKTMLETRGSHCNFIRVDGERGFERYLKLREFRKQKQQGTLDKSEVYSWIIDSNWSSSYQLELLKELCDKPSTEYSTEIFINNFLIVETPDANFIRNAQKVHGVKFNQKYHDMDFYFPDIKLGIEINGLAHHSVNAPTKSIKTKDYHFRKFLKFHESGIKVISFTDWDLYNRWDSVKNIIKHHLLGDEIEESTKVEFPDLYQSLNYGLFDYNKFEEKLQMTRNFEDFVEAKIIDGFEYWDCGEIK